MGIFKWFKKLFLRMVEVETQEPLSEAPLKERVKSTRKKRLKKDKAQPVFGEFRTARELLEGIEELFNIFDTTRHSKLDVFNRIFAYGPHIINLKEHKYKKGELLPRIMASGIEDNFKVFKTPSVLCAYWQTNRDTDVAQFFLAEKFYRLPGVEFPKNEDIYAMSNVWVGKDKEYYPIECFIGVNRKTGAVRVLRTSFTQQRRIKSKRGGYTSWSESKWAHKYLIADDDTIKKFEAEGGFDPMEHTLEIFCMVYNGTMFREYGINIHVSRGGKNATFVVPANEWKDFFKERLAVYEDGVKKNIFHSVAAHSRIVDGEEKFVKAHFRGLRKFHWKGLDIVIAVPDLHGASRASFDVPLYTDSRLEPNTDLSQYTDDTLYYAESLNALFDDNNVEPLSRQLKRRRQQQKRLS